MSVRKLFPILILALGLLSLGVVTAQQAMTPEELESYIDKQRAALERVKKNRELTEEKARAAREALAEQDARRAELEAQMESLCAEREAVEASTYEACLGEYKN